MIHMRDLQQGQPEDVRQVLCGQPATDVPSTNGALEWWRARAELCPLCWDEWCRVVEVLGTLPSDALAEVLAVVTEAPC